MRIPVLGMECQSQLYIWVLLFYNLMYTQKEMSLCGSESVCICLPSFWPNLWVNISETWHDEKFRPNLKHQLKILENC